jgi:hypothetical protein
MYSSGTPSTVSILARPRTRRGKRCAVSHLKPPFVVCERHLIADALKPKVIALRKGAPVVGDFLRPLTDKDVDGVSRRLG